MTPKWHPMGFEVSSGAQFSATRTYDTAHNEDERHNCIAHLHADMG